MPKATGELEDSNASVKTLLTRLGEELRSVTLKNEPRNSLNDPQHPQQVKERPDHLIETSILVVQRYHMFSQAHAELANGALFRNEMKHLCIAWQADVEHLMIPECLHKYQELVREADEFDRMAKLRAKAKKARAKARNARATTKARDKQHIN